MTYRRYFILLAKLLKRVSKQYFDILQEEILMIINVAIEREQQ